MRRAGAIVVAALMLAFAPAASALRAVGRVTTEARNTPYPGSYLTYQGLIGSENLVVDWDAGGGRVTFHDRGGAIILASGVCSGGRTSTVVCDLNRDYGPHEFYESVTAAGGPGNDFIQANHGPTNWGNTVALSGDDGADVLIGGGLNPNRGGNGADLLIGSDGSDNLDGGAGADRLYGLGGDDFLYDGDGVTAPPWADLLDCGAGDDTGVLAPNDRAVSCEHRDVSVSPLPF